MKRLSLFWFACLLLLAAVSLAVAATGDFTFYYQIESPPRSLPGVNANHDGVMIFVRTQDGPISACADYTTSGATHRICSPQQPPDATDAMQPIRLDFGTGAESFTVTRIAVTVGDATKAVANAVPGTEY